MPCARTMLPIAFVMCAASPVASASFRYLAINFGLSRYSLASKVGDLGIVFPRSYLVRFHQQPVAVSSLTPPGVGVHLLRFSWRSAASYHKLISVEVITRLGKHGLSVPAFRLRSRPRRSAGRPHVGGAPIRCAVVPWLAGQTGQSVRDPFPVGLGQELGRPDFAGCRSIA